ncbi:MAG: hypothetical protein JSW11_16140 [Candidatus Heimdallarchaeota archaeon]|nr:MAG: hypothetical protein JSW11_16140 [Candidatus Heimdallarchaeota archaeon]
MISDLRKELFDIFAKYYEEYGIPRLCGLIDTLFLFEPVDTEGSKWTQRAISKKLTDLFPDGKFSVSSINRAIKINEKYGTVLKEGSHKTGYTYSATSGIEMISKIFEGFIEKTDVCINELNQLLDKSHDTDPTLKKILEEQIFGYLLYNQILEKALNFFKEEFSKMLPTGGI